ncbi:MAG TPA: FeoB-associated Cys-rich membrane protein [Bacteroidales bacterium]|nr:FeoB-associated Cys-rich membrane protein [Bacteroidales bacterium]
MMQEIITYGIIAVALAYTVYSIVISLKPNSKKSACGGCTGCDFKKNQNCHLSAK